VDSQQILSSRFIPFQNVDSQQILSSRFIPFPFQIPKDVKSDCRTQKLSSISK